MNVLIILGHPRRESFCGALADSYGEGARQAGTVVKTIWVGGLNFEKNVTLPHPDEQFLEQDLVSVQEDIRWAHHLVFIFPTWWGSMPGILKSLLDRVFTPQFAFTERRKWDYQPLLKGKTAQVIITMDTPAYVYTFFYRAPGKHTLVNSTLRFCGVSPIRVKLISPIKYSTLYQRQQWLKRVEDMGRQLEKGIHTPFEKGINRLSPWLKALRLQFYPMTLVAYTVGALAARYYGFGFDGWVLLIGYLFLFFLEAATVFSNDYVDYRSDVANKNYSLFTGGSRVLIDTPMSFRTLQKGIVLCLLLLIPIFIGLSYISPASFFSVLLTGLSITVLALGYTLPPLKLSWHGLGEADVALTHSLGVMLCGFVFQGGTLTHPSVWLLSFPLLCAIMPAIIMAGMPDYEADKAVAKRTLPVRLGKNTACLLAMGFVGLACGAGLYVYRSGLLDEFFGKAIYLTIPHAIYIIACIERFRSTKEKPALIPEIMVACLLYIFWFGIIPLVKLLEYK